AARRLENVRRALAPARRHDHHAQAIWPEILRKGAASHEPAAHEIATRLLRPALVDRAAALAAKVARYAGLHLVAVDRALHPAVAAGRAGAASALAGGCKG